jgi:glycerol-3-phosphate dehydrogenase
MSRQSVIDSLARKPEISVLIIGAGINGIGTFRDLALQGVDVLLIDRGDFCSGASAASGRMAHGGIRYLENGEFRLVRESLLERNRLLLNAPHAVVPIPITIPIFSWFSGVLNAPLKFLNLLQKPSERGAIVVKIGLVLYDFFTRAQRVTPKHRLLMRPAALKLHPHLNPDIVCAANYYDALIPQAERLAIEAMLDGEAAYDQAHALNYASSVSAAGDTVQLRDEVTGQLFEVKPRLVINASGAWIDFVNRDLKHPTRFIGGTKGSHIVVDHAELRETLNGNAIYFETRDGRLAIFLPFGGKVIIGTTDIRIDHPDQARCTDEEIDYMLDFTSHILPGIRVTRADIVFHFSGVRPLPSADVEFAGFVSRDHSIKTIEPNETIHFPVYSLVGGKWTTFRAFSEQVADKLLEKLGLKRKVDTGNLAIGGGENYPHGAGEKAAWIKALSQKSGLPVEQITLLFERYGTRAQAYAEYIAAEPDKIIRTTPTYTHREIMFIAQNERVIHLEDVILRRSLLGMLGYIDGAVLEKLSKAVGSVLGWTEEQIRAEIERTAHLLQTQHGVPAELLQQVMASASKL